MAQIDRDALDQAVRVEDRAVFRCSEGIHTLQDLGARHAGSLTCDAGSDSLEMGDVQNRGVIHGALMGWSAIGIFRVTPLLKSHVDLPMGTRSFFVGIHKRVYDKLPRAGKAAIDKNSGLDFSMALGTYYERDGTKLRNNSGSRNVVRPDAAAQKELFKKFKPFHDAWQKKVKDGEKKYQAIQEILAKHRGSS